MAADPRDPDDDEFERAMEGVQKLRESAPGGRARRYRPSRRAPLDRPGPEHRFNVERYGEQVEALVVGGDRKQLTRLHRGEPPPEAEIDLHGLQAREARRTVHRAVREAFEGGVRCLLVIHGRARLREGPAVLKHAVPDWLIEPPVAPLVLAFCTAPIEHGGAGAVLVLLRRNKSPAGGRRHGAE